MSIPRAATSVQIRKRACANRASNQKARRRKSDQSESAPAKKRPSKSMPAENSGMLMQCVRPMRKRASTPNSNNHKGIYKDIQSKSMPVQTETGINHGCVDKATL
jgi:hypothetical protein